ncbi:MAG: hypothetical protein H7199_09415 [Burkholderiales bacterium]|nr:hypothetical protein [Flavobacterium sp.]
MKSFKLFLGTLVGSILLVSCNKEELPVFASLGNYENGIFVLNEGNAAAGSVSFIKNNSLFVNQNIFAAENPTANGIGGYVQSIFFDGEKAFIISGSNKITVVNRYTFKLIGTVESGLANPRYGVVVGGKAYVTNSKTNSFENPATGNTDDYISVINLSTLQVESTINIDAIADKIAFINGKIYITNGTYGEGNSLTIIDPLNNTIIKTLTFGNSPNSMEESNGNLYVLCSNFANASELVKVNLATDEIASNLILPNALGNAQNLNVENGNIYFTVDSKVFSSPLNSASISETPLFTSTATTLYGFTVKNTTIYLSDAKDYNSDGGVFIYSTSGTLVNQFTVGLIPNGFYFN